MGSRNSGCLLPWLTRLISRSFQAPLVFQCPSLVGQHGAALALLEEHRVDNRGLQLCHLEGERLGNNSHPCLLLNSEAADHRAENITYWMHSHTRKVPSYCHQTLSKCARRHAGPRPDRPSSTLEKRTAESRCGTCWKRPASLRLSRSTSPTPRLPASNPGSPSVSCRHTFDNHLRAQMQVEVELGSRQVLQAVSIYQRLNQHTGTQI